MTARYKEVAEHAAALERSKMYLSAARYWDQAERLASSEENARWANSRAFWCRNGREGWKFGDEE